MTEHLTNSEDETMALAAALAKRTRAGTLYALSGDLGAGKSAFARGFVRALMGEVDVPSPTFTLVQMYDTPRGPLYHFDLYRLEVPEEIFELGWDEAVAEGICLIEWPDKAGPYLPAAAIRINITTLQGESRKIVIHEPDSR